MNNILNKKLVILLGLLFSKFIVYGQAASFYDQKFKNVTFGSNSYDEGKQIFRCDRNVYVFGITRSTTINNDVVNVYGNGDIFIEKYDSVGAVTYKMIGGGGFDNLIKVEQDSFGFWLYIQSQSGIGGTRTRPLTCYPSYGFNQPYYSDLWIVRLDNNLNQVADYSMCLDFLHVNVTEQYIRCVEFNKTTKKVKMVVMGKDSLSTEFTNYLLITDTTGLVIDKTYLGRAQKTVTITQGTTTSISTSKYYINKIITQSDSITLFLQDLMHHINYFQQPGGSTKWTYTSGNLIRLNTLSKKYRNTVIKTTKSDNKLITGIHKNGKLHLYSNCIATPSTGRNLDSLYLNSYPTRINRAAAAHTIQNKTDVWCVVLDSANCAFYSEYAIGSNDSTTISGAFIYNNKIHLNLSSKGAVSYDKTLPSKGGIDYWLMNLTSSNTPDKQIVFGGPKDDVLSDVSIFNGSMFLTGISKSSNGGDKSANSRDGNLIGDCWTQSSCYTPIVNYTTNATHYPNGSLLTITNTTQNAINYNWSFLDKTGSYILSKEKNPSTYLYNADTVTIFLAVNNYNCYVWTSSKVLVDPYYVGIDDLTKEEYMVYPNPFNEFLYVKSQYGSVYEYELYNIVGEVVMKGVTDNNREIITAGLIPGAYTLLIKQKNKSVNYKLIKQ